MLLCFELPASKDCDGRDLDIFISGLIWIVDPADARFDSFTSTDNFIDLYIQYKMHIQQHINTAPPITPMIRMVVFISSNKS